MQVIGDVKCYHCGHISGQVEGARSKPVGGQAGRLVLISFRPRPGFQGEPPGAGDRLRCERCSGPVYLEDLRPLVPEALPMLVPTEGARKRGRPSKSKAA